MSGIDPIVTPVRDLSQQEFGSIQTLGLVLFGSAHLALAVATEGLDYGRLWPYGRSLLAASGLVLFWVAFTFLTGDPSTTDHNDPLWLVATLIGVAMGTFQPGLARLSPGLGLFCALCLGVWMLLIPLVLLVNESWLGAYERLVGAVYLVWVAGVTLGLLQLLEIRQSAES